MSTISVDNIEDRSAAETVDAAYVVHGTFKSWADYQQTGTPTVDASFNVTSVTDNTTGDATVNLTNSMDSANYPALGMSNNSWFVGFNATARTAGACGFKNVSDAGTPVDQNNNSFAILGDLLV